MADDGNVECLQQWARRFQPSGRIVVAGDEDDVEMRRAGLGLLQEAVELLLRCGGGICIVEDVA